MNIYPETIDQIINDLWKQVKEEIMFLKHNPEDKDIVDKFQHWVKRNLLTQAIAMRINYSAVLSRENEILFPEIENFLKYNSI